MNVVWSWLAAGAWSAAELHVTAVLSLSSGPP